MQLMDSTSAPSGIFLKEALILCLNLAQSTVSGSFQTLKFILTTARQNQELLIGSGVKISAMWKWILEILLLLIYETHKVGLNSLVRVFCLF